MEAPLSPGLRSIRPLALAAAILLTLALGPAPLVRAQVQGHADRADQNMMAPSEGPASSATAAAPSAATAPGTAATTPAAPAQTPAPGAALIPPGSPSGIATPPPVAATPVLVTPATTPPVDLVTVQQGLIRLESQARQTSDDQRLAAMRTASASAQATADKLVAAHDRDLRRIDQELNRMGAAPRPGESDAVRKRRALLTTQRGELEGELKQAQTVDVAANKTYDLVAQRRRDAFSARVFTQTASPITPAFWSSLADATTSDFSRFVSVTDQAVDVAARAREPRAVLALLGALVVAVLLLFPARRTLERVGRPKGRDQAARQGFPVTANAVWIALVDTLLPGLAATSLHIGAQWGGLLSDKANAFAQSGVVAVAWGAAVLALGRATVARDDPAARLVPVPDEAVRRIRAYLWTVALITGAGFLLTRINDLVGASVAATVAANCARAIAYAGVAGLLLVNFGRSRASAHEGEPEPDSASSSGWTLVSLALTGAIVVTLGAVFAGYTTLAVLVSGQIFWLSLIAALAYLLLRFADDLCGELFRSHGWAARTLFTLFNLRTTTIDQIGVLTAAALQVVILLGALSLALTPFGQSGDLLMTHFEGIGRTVHIGSVTISPSAVVAALACLVVGLGAVHFLRGWVVRRYLPVTDWDVGVRNSVSTGLSYLGIAITLLCALAAAGLSFKQVALVASALSVGIGFGLQQVVQNFVSGLILLIERPVKVGDWVNVAGVEGDVRNIRVRATEIQTFDKTMVIVPNSDLITKTVQNKTLGDPRGRVQLQLSLANPKDAGRAAELILAAAKGHAEVLDDPAPSVFIDSLAPGAVNLTSFAYVASARDAYRVRSNLYFTLLDALGEAEISLTGSTPQAVVVEPGAGVQALIDAAAKLAPGPSLHEAQGPVPPAGEKV